MSIANLATATKKAGINHIADVPILAGLARGIVDLQDRLVLRVNSAGLLVSANAATSSLASTLPLASYEVVTATNVIDADENGRTYFLSSATEFVSTLPAPFLGARFTFIVSAAPSGASYTIVTASSGNIIKGQQYPASGAAGDTGTADDTITFVDGQAVAGDRVELFSDGTSWFAYAFSAVAAGVTFTQASA